MDVQEEFTILLKRHTSLLCGAIKKCGIYSKNPDYHDYLQIARIAFYEAFLQFPTKPITLEVEKHFTGFAFNRICWAVGDYQRKIASQLQHDADYQQAILERYIAPAALSYEETLDTFLLAQQLFALLSEKEQTFLMLHFIQGKKISEIAEELGTSRKSVYRSRNRVAQVFLQFMSETN